MARVDFKQGSQEWHTWRASGIGASDSPIIMGVSPWSTRKQLWLEKTTGKRRDQANAATRHGHEKENEVRLWAEMLFGIALPPACFESDDYSWLRASLDGISSDNKIAIEIKCPYKNFKDHELARQQKIPAKYKWQLVHQMLAANLQQMYYISFDGKDKQCVPFQLDAGMAAELISELEDFKLMIDEKREPENSVAEAVKIEDENWLELARNYASIDRQIKLLEARRSGMRAALCDMAGDHAKITGSGITISRLERRGQIDYSQIPQLSGVNLDLFRRASTQSFYVTTTE